MSEIAKLLERVKSATGPDREVDGDLFFEFDPDFPNFAMHMSALPDPATFATGAYTSVKAPAYTASIDAALALTERVLPGFQVLMGYGQTIKTKPWARVGDWRSSDAIGETLPLAILTATLTALQDQRHEQ